MEKRLSYICQLLVDKNVREQVREYLKPSMIQNRLLKAFYEVLLSYETSEIDTNVFISELLKKTKVTEVELDLIIPMIAGHHPISDELLPKAITSVFDYVKETKLEYLMNLSLTGSMNTDTAIRHISDLSDLKYESNDNYVDMSDMQQLKVMKVEELPSEGIIKSSIGIINEVSTHKGYIPGDVVQVIAPPGVGKSMFMCQEGAYALLKGHKVAHIVLGDLNTFDLYTRYTSRLKDTSIASVVADASRDILHNLPVYRNLKMSVHPPEVLDADEIYRKVQKLIDNGWKPDLVLLDYDLNVRGDRENMYQTGGYLYNKLKALAMINKLVVMVATQPKTQYNESEVIGKGAASESSRKQQIVDWMITMGKNPKCPEVGTMHFPKARRGGDGISIRIAFESGKGLIRTINKQEYDDRLNNWNNSDIDSLIAEYGGLNNTGLRD